MVIRRISRSDIEKEPYQLWNAFIDLLAMEEYESLNNVQRIAYLSFWYDSEVNNGGHLQYFENQGIHHLEETISALKNIGADKQSQILSAAGKRYLKKRRNPVLSAAEFVFKALEGEFDEFDSKYYNCSPTVNDFLEKYLKSHQDQFVQIF